MTGAMVVVTEVAPYADGPAGVHGVLDQAVTALGQLARMHDLDPAVVTDVGTLAVDRLAAARVLARRRARRPDFGYPIAWCVREGRGRVFTTALGHFPAAWESPAYLRHLHGGLTWTLARPEDAE